MAARESTIKKMSTTTLANHVAEKLQLLRRLEESDDNGYTSCVTCGVTKHYKDGMQGGHFIERTKSATKLEETNISVQCSYCNAAMGKFGKSSVAYEYYTYMVENYGEDHTKELIDKSKGEHKWSRPDLIEKLRDIEYRITEEQNRVTG